LCVRLRRIATGPTIKPKYMRGRTRAGKRTGTRQDEQSAGELSVRFKRTG
jgi:hypothetical protein